MEGLSTPNVVAIDATMRTFGDKIFALVSPPYSEFGVIHHSDDENKITS